MFFSNQKKESLSLIWRIDSASISATIIDQDSRIRYYNSETITIFVMDDRHMYDQLMYHTEQIVARIIADIISSTRTVPEQATIVFGEPWTQSIRRHIVYKRKTPFKLTKTFIHDLIVRDMKRVAKEYDSDDIEFITPTYHELLIAGHSTGDYFGKSVNDIRFDYVTGFTDNKIVQIVRNQIHEKMKVPMLSISLDHYQNFLIRFWRQIKLTDGLCIDTSGFITDLYIFKNNQLVQAGTLPLGLGMLHNELASFLEIYPQELQTLLSLYQRKLTSPVITNRIEAGLRSLYTAWQADFQMFCSHAIGQGDIISQVVWSDDSSDPILQFFMRELASNTIQFPIVFGTNQVGFLHIESLVDNVKNNISIPGNAHVADKIIIAGLS